MLSSNEAGGLCLNTAANNRRVSATWEIQRAKNAPPSVLIDFDGLDDLTISPSRTETLINLDIRVRLFAAGLSRLG